MDSRISAIFISIFAIYLYYISIYMPMIILRPMCKNPRNGWIWNWLMPMAAC